MHPNRAITYWHKHPQLLRLNVLVNQFLNSHSFTRREQQPSGINTPNDKVLAVVPKFSWHGGDVAVGSGLRCMTPVRRTDGRTDVANFRQLHPGQFTPELVRISNRASHTHGQCARNGQRIRTNHSKFTRSTRTSVYFQPWLRRSVNRAMNPRVYTIA